MWIEQNWIANKLQLSQSDYICKLLKPLNMEKVKSTSTLLPMLIQLMDKDSLSTDKEKELTGKIPHASAVGSIIYTIVATRPDLAYAVGIVNRYMLNPRQKHWEAFKHIFSYMRGTKDAQLTFGLANPIKVEGYTDFDYAGNMDKYIHAFILGCINLC